MVRLTDHIDDKIGLEDGQIDQICGQIGLNDGKIGKIDGKIGLDDGQNDRKMARLTRNTVRLTI